MRGALLALAILLGAALVAPQEAVARGPGRNAPRAVHHGSGGWGHHGGHHGNYSGGTVIIWGNAGSYYGSYYRNPYYYRPYRPYYGPRYSPGPIFVPFNQIYNVPGY